MGKTKCKNGMNLRKGSPRRFVVDKKDFKTKPNSKGKTGWTRYKVCEDGSLEKVKPELWTDEANALWDEAIARGVNMDTTNIELKSLEAHKKKRYFVMQVIRNLVMEQKIVLTGF